MLAILYSWIVRFLITYVPASVICFLVKLIKPNENNWILIN